MHRFFFGILLVQFVTIAIVWLNLFGTLSPAAVTTTVAGNSDSSESQMAILLRTIVPLLLLTLMAAFWFAGIGRSVAENTIAKMKASHARDREKIQLNAEKAKTRIVKETQKEIRKEARRASGQANRKVGLAFFGTAVAGVLMIITELVTMGLMTMMTAGGALGGYLFRGKRERKVSSVNLDYAESAEDQSGPYEVLEPAEPPRLIEDQDR